MALLVKFLIVLLLVGTGVQQGWFEAVGRFVTERVGDTGELTATAETAGLDAAQRAFDLYQALPEPWHGLTLTVGSLIGLLVVFWVVRTIVVAALWIAHRFRDALI